MIMKIVKFDEQNVEIAKDQPEYQTLPPLMLSVNKGDVILPVDPEELTTKYTDHTKGELREQLWKAAQCVFMACEEEVAADISGKLQAAVDRIDELEFVGEQLLLALKNAERHMTEIGVSHEYPVLIEARRVSGFARAHFQALEEKVPEVGNEKPEWKCSVCSAVVPEVERYRVQVGEKISDQWVDMCQSCYDDYISRGCPVSGFPSIGRTVCQNGSVLPIEVEGGAE